MTQPIPAATPWGDRWSLLDKRLSYVFSLSIDLQLDDWDGHDRRLRLSAADTATDAGPSLFHVFDERISPTADGSLHELPSAYLASAQQWLDVRPSGDASLHGRLVFETELGDPLTIECRGVAAVRGSFGRTLERIQVPGTSARGTSFIATRHECCHPKYRWLVLQQLIGFGELTLSPTETPHSYRFSFRYDLYAGLASGG